jgi:hypothetical protein
MNQRDYEESPQLRLFTQRRCATATAIPTMTELLCANAASTCGLDETLCKNDQHVASRSQPLGPPFGRRRPNPRPTDPAHEPTFLGAERLSGDAKTRDAFATRH